MKEYIVIRVLPAYPQTWLSRDGTTNELKQAERFKATDVEMARLRAVEEYGGLWSIRPNPEDRK